MSARNSPCAGRHERLHGRSPDYHRNPGARIRRRKNFAVTVLALFAMTAVAPAFGQRGRAGSDDAPRARPAAPHAAGEAAQGTARAAAPVDLTGTWVSVISEDWAWRMRTPPRGDYASLPLNEAAIRVADRWTSDQDGSCLAYGAAASLRMPTRARISWADDNTLRIDIDNGAQTRLLHFDGGQPDAGPTLQGHSVARWLTTATVTGSGATGGILTSALDKPAWASLEVVTTHMLAAWLRPNGVPYSQNAVLTEYFDRFADGDDEWFTVTIVVDDLIYLTQPLVISSNFKREPDDSKWRPRPCRD